MFPKIWLFEIMGCLTSGYCLQSLQQFKPRFLPTTSCLVFNIRFSTLLLQHELRYMKHATKGAFLQGAAGSTWCYFPSFICSCGQVLAPMTMRRKQAIWEISSTCFKFYYHPFVWLFYFRGWTGLEQTPKISDDPSSMPFSKALEYPNIIKSPSTDA